MAVRSCRDRPQSRGRAFDLLLLCFSRCPITCLPASTQGSPSAIGTRCVMGGSGWRGSSDPPAALSSTAARRSRSTDRVSRTFVGPQSGWSPPPLWARSHGTVGPGRTRCQAFMDRRDHLLVALSGVGDRRGRRRLRSATSSGAPIVLSLQTGDQRRCSSMTSKVIAKGRPSAGRGPAPSGATRVEAATAALAACPSCRARSILAGRRSQRTSTSPQAGSDLRRWCANCRTTASRARAAPGRALQGPWRDHSDSRALGWDAAGIALDRATNPSNDKRLGVPGDGLCGRGLYFPGLGIPLKLYHDRVLGKAGVRHVHLAALVVPIPPPVIRFLLLRDRSVATLHHAPT